MFDRFTRSARAAVVHAQQEAATFDHDHIGTEHLLLGLLAQPGTTAHRLLTQGGLDLAGARAAVLGRLGPFDDLDAEGLSALGIDLDAVRERVEATFGPGALDAPPPTSSRRRAHIPFTPRAKAALEYALREAGRLDQREITDGHVLLGILREGGGLACRVVVDAGLDLPDLRRDLDEALTGTSAA